MKTSEQINEIAKALALAQGMMKPAVFDSENTFFKKGNKNSKYASLKSCMECIREPFSTNGLSIAQDVITTNESIGITTILFHSSGQFIEFGTCFFNPKDKTVQSYGGAITYGKRYCLCANLSIVADEDDDGNEATFGSHIPKKDESPYISETEYKTIMDLISKCNPTRQTLTIDEINGKCQDKNIRKMLKTDFPKIADVLFRRVQAYQESLKEQEKPVEIIQE